MRLGVSNHEPGATGDRHRHDPAEQDEAAGQGSEHRIRHRLVEQGASAVGQPLPLPNPTWIAFAEHCEATGAEPDELRQTTFGQSAEDWEIEYSATVSLLRYAGWSSESVR